MKHELNKTMKTLSVINSINEFNNMFSQKSDLIMKEKILRIQYPFQLKEMGIIRCFIIECKIIFLPK